MRRPSWRRLALLLPGLALPHIASAQRALTRDEVRERFRTNNASLLAGSLLIDESRAGEVTAGLRPSPVFSSINQFLDAQQSYRDTQLAYQNLVGSYFSALNQLSQEVRS